MRRLAIVLALIVLSLVAFRIAMGPVFDSQWFRGLVKAGVERGLGVEPTLVGSVHPAFSLIPGVDFESVHVRSPEGADWWLDADVQRASLRIGLLPLLWGKLEVLRFEVDGLELRFELPPDDGSDEPSSFDLAGLLDRLPSVTRLTNAKIQRGRNGAADLEVAVAKAALRRCGDQVDFDGQVNGIPLALEAQLECEGLRTLRFENLDARVFDTPVAGALLLSIGDPGGPRLAGALRAAHLKLDAASDFDAAGASELDTWLDRKLRYELLEPLNLDLGIDVAALEVAGLSFSSVSAKAKLADSQLEFSAHGELFEGKVDLGLRARGGRSESLGLSLKLDGLPLAEWFGKQQVSGAFDLHAEIAGVGETPRAVLASGNGSLDFSLGEANFPAGLLGPLGKEIFYVMTDQFKSAQPTRFECVIVRSEFHDGVGAPTVLVVDTLDTTLAGGGILDLRKLHADVLLRPHSKSTKIIPVNTPLRIAGPFTDLSAGLDKTELAMDTGRLLSVGMLDPRNIASVFVDLGSGEQDPCKVDLKQATRTKSASLLEAPGAATRGLRKWVMGIFESAPKEP